MASFSRLAFQSLDACRLDLLDLLLDEAQTIHVAPQLGQRVRRHRSTLRCLQCLQLPGRLSQVRPEAANAEPGEISFHSVYEGVTSFTRFSRSRLGRLASSSAIVGTAAMLQCFGSPRSQPRKARLRSSVSSRSVFARLCSRDTGTLDGWITWASISWARSQRASQKPSRPAS